MPVLLPLMALSAADIRNAFDMLAQELTAGGEQAELLIAGGAALVLLFDARETTKDVDAYFIKPDAATFRDAGARAAERLGLPRDWLNDAAKGYFQGLTHGDVVYNSPSLLVRAVTTPQLLAMKLAAWRDAVDRSDARLLLKMLSGTKLEIWERIFPHVPPRDRDKASYAFEDLWESTYGTS
jgi:predicted nucleotidyltransferase